MENIGPAVFQRSLVRMDVIPYLDQDEVVFAFLALQQLAGQASFGGLDDRHKQNELVTQHLAAPVDRAKFVDSCNAHSQLLHDDFTVAALL
jgi:hypothetical protein